MRRILDVLWVASIVVAVCSGSMWLMTKFIRPPPNARAKDVLLYAVILGVLGGIKYAFSKDRQR